MQGSEISVTTKTLPEMTIVGISTQTTNTTEMDSSTAKIPGLWGHFWSNNVLAKIPNKQEHTVVGVYTNYENDHQGEYTLFIGAPVFKRVTTTEAGMKAITIPPGRYLVFSNQGLVMSQVVMQTWQFVWQYFETNKQYQRAYAADTEWYDLSSPEKVEIYIGIHDKTK